MEKMHAFLDLSEEDILDAMKEIEGYVDITPSDFQKIYDLAFKHAFQRLNSLRSAKEIMSSPVFSISAKITAKEAVSFLAAQNIRGVPVVDEAGTMIGIVTEKEFMTFLGVNPKTTFLHILSACLEDTDPIKKRLQNATLSDIMKPSFITATEEMSVSEISSLFLQHTLSHLVVCDEKRHPVGMISRRDLIGVLCE